MDSREMDALLDVLEYDALAVGAYDDDPGYWTWRRPGLQFMQMQLVVVRQYLRRWKRIDGPLV